MPILFRGCDLNDAFLTEADLMNRFVGQDLFVWGSGALGRLGNNVTGTFSSPVQTLAAETNWLRVSASGNSSQSVGLKTNGTLWTWGAGGDGVLGNSSVVTRSSPVQTTGSATNWKSACAGSSMTGAVKTDGTLWMWGLGTNGRLGTNATTSSSTPAQVFGSATNWKDISLATHAHAIKTDGTLWGWGSNGFGRLGDNTTTNKSTPIQVYGSATNWKNVAAGDPSLALKTDGSLWTWGSSGSGGIGNDNSINISSPVQTVSGGTNWRVVSNGGNGGVASIKTDGTLWNWGFASGGRLGNNSTVNRSSPVQTVSGGTTWRIVGSGPNASGAIKTDGTLWMWGVGYVLGDNTSVNKSSPVQTVAGGTFWRSINVGVGRSGGTRITGE